MNNNNSSSICLFWVQTQRSWGTADWLWSECELASEICNVWGTDKHLWKNENSWWSLCFGSGSIPPQPITSSVSLQQPGIDATTIVQPWLIEPWNPYTANDEHDKKRKRLIKLICKVKGETYTEEKPIGTMKVSVDDIKMVVKKVLNIDLDVKI